MTLNSFIVVLNDQTAVEGHHHNCVCLLHWLFLVNLILAFVSDGRCVNGWVVSMCLSFVCCIFQI